MYNEKIDFHRVRDFGEVINATFQFIRQNFRKLLFTVLYIGGPFALLSGVIVTVFQSQVQGAMKGTFQIGFSPDVFTTLSIYVLVISIASMVVTATVYHFILLYKEEKEFDISDVWRLVRRDFLMLFFTSLGAFILITFATFCFLIPGIYTLVAISIIFIVRFVERIGFFDAVSRSFKLVSGRWWRTFGILFIMYIVQWIISNIAVAPLYIVGAIFGLLSPMASIMAGGATTMMGIFISALTNILSILCGSIIIVALAFHYFSLVEEKEGRGLMSKIRTMGTQPSTTRPEEEEEY